MAATLLPDALWDLIEPFLPSPPRRPNGGRPHVPDRACLTGILFVLRSGIPWQMLPQELGCGSGMTRRLLERIPEADFAWKPHDKSFSLGQLGGHIANILHWVDATCDVTVFDLATAGDDARPTEPTSVADLLKTFDANVKKARQKIDAQPDAALLAQWTMKQGDHEIMTMPRIAVLRSFIMNHLIHHRGQLSVYLRLRNVPLPSIYGPTADEK